MNNQVRDFVSTYKPKPSPNPFFGFFREGEKGINGTGQYYFNKKNKQQENKKSVLKCVNGAYYRRKNYSSLYIIAGELFKEGYSFGEIALNLNKTKNQVRSLIHYYKQFYE